MTSMNVRQNASLSQCSTMRLGGNALYLTEVQSRSEVEEAVQWAEARQVPVIMIGIGSNIIWTDKGFPGLVIVNKIKRFEVFKEDAENVYITVGAGENWDNVVERSVVGGLTGIEALSLIPGTTGATPVQNVGAYGQEIANTLVSVEAYDKQARKFTTMSNVDCAFRYRTSRFKTTDKNRFFITAITLHLRHANPEPPFYASVQSYFTERHITSYSPQILRDAVVAIRTSKLPDPSKVANNGSFFTNPIVDAGTFTDLIADHSNMQYWQLDDGRYKLSAAWMIEQAGFKDAHDAETGMATWGKQPLVLVNEHARSTADLLHFKQKIVDKVQQLFNVTLVQEPELIGAR